MANTADKIYDMIVRAVESQGVDLWDVVFVKEGASHYLRVFIDSPDGVTIDDCTNVSHAIDPIIDEADPIDVSYYLEVSSPGLNRELKKEKHFKAFIGSDVTVKLYKAFDGKKQITGKLIGYDGGPVLKTDSGEQIGFDQSQISKVLLNDDF
ncbi:MAG: ribosome maturation factor RimP [Clostridia bacterium]|nr:ribosome maturation factor RimP [Clostridia bacterium]